MKRINNKQQCQINKQQCQTTTSNISKSFQFPINDNFKPGKCFFFLKIIESQYSNTAWYEGKQLRSLSKHNGNKQVVYSATYVLCLFRIDSLDLGYESVSHLGWEWVFGSRVNLFPVVTLTIKNSSKSLQSKNDLFPECSKL